ncbi:metalloregulator ArsR/SmtB family transcription factor [Acidiphilium sp. AL]|uniref:Metalloregulator ArsR/SmtB family transcription factor n=1 Tax=Acidiphilium iwatense TaxID=768198 RepID=A0ABS9DTY5_9PROT|nr:MULTISPECIES: metalloregulator ArsR/SmtB family transcription factor [Acidiphilium]MCF3945250.1 metalloregulator ArsR/SmtB family transcription factor [Acidiphilium iwatense]MCU4159457.1 metalloregulator ArsR/SmtB family transcription factor [Acidiphilium sp. AL]
MLYFELVNALKALADRKRLTILGHLAQGEQKVQDLAALAGIKPPTASHHLSTLRKAGLVRLRLAGTTHWYALIQENLTEIGDILLTRDGTASLAHPVMSREADCTIAAPYLRPDTSITEIPQSARKRRAVLGYIISRIDKRRRIREPDLDYDLKQFYPDIAQLKSLFLSHRMMGRKGAYWWVRPDADWLMQPKVPARLRPTKR